MHKKNNQGKKKVKAEKHLFLTSCKEQKQKQKPKYMKVGKLPLKSKIHVPHTVHTPKSSSLKMCRETERGAIPGV